MHASTTHDTVFLQSHAQRRRSRARRGALWLTAAALGALVGVACDRDSDCTPGTEACICTSNGGCLPHLECLSDYCVDPNWTPSAEDEGDDDDDDGIASVTADDDDDGDDDDGGTHDNVGACEAWIDGYECGGFDLGQSLDCSLYANTACDISDYFDCLTDNTTCTNGFPDTSGWAACIDLAMCE